MREDNGPEKALSWEEVGEAQLLTKVGGYPGDGAETWRSAALGLGLVLRNDVMAD